jgi:LytS/YehU family sensor histidine kinase
MTTIDEMSGDELKQKLKATRAIQITIGGILGVIILTWILSGYWRTNLAVFISTIAMGVTTVAITSVAPRRFAAEIKRRKS